MYRGRFAPSPTGPLHFGSLVAAVASYLEAKANGGEWLVRIEDLDTPRCVPGAADDILRCLEAFGMHWDGAPLYQSRRTDAYRAALEQLQHDGAVYGCACSRSEIAAVASPGVDGPVYPGTCRNGPPAGRAIRAWRVRSSNARIAFTDAIQGAIAQDVEHEVGDFVLHRADGLFAYQLAVVVDDAAQGITGVVRGADLLDSTPRQIWLQRLLRLSMPRYAHVPIAVNARGEKLSKQTHAAAMDYRHPAPALVRVLHFLHQDVPAVVAHEPLPALWRWAHSRWHLQGVPSVRSQCCSAQD